MPQKERLTVGYRAMVKKVNEGAWSRYAGREVLLTERTDGGRFSFMLLAKGIQRALPRREETVGGEGAWIEESELVLVDKEVTRNLEFIDWYREWEMLHEGEDDDDWDLDD